MNLKNLLSLFKHSSPTTTPTVTCVTSPSTAPMTRQRALQITEEAKQKKEKLNLKIALAAIDGKIERHCEDGERSQTVAHLFDNDETVEGRPLVDVIKEDLTRRGFEVVLLCIGGHKTNLLIKW